MRSVAGSERGATLVESAIVLALFIFIVMGIIDFSRVVASNSALNTASREASRYGASTGNSINSIPRYTDCDEIRAAATSFDLVVEIEPADITVSYDHGPGSAVFATCPVGGPNPSAASITNGDRIIVQIDKSFGFVSPAVGQFFAPYSLQAIDRRTIAVP